MNGTPMNKLERIIRDLCEGYEGYWMTKMVPLERRQPHDWSLIVDWGNKLKGAQEYLGIYMVPADQLEASIREAMAAGKGKPAT